MKTPEEIKKGLGCLSNYDACTQNCKDCEYSVLNYSDDDVATDALDFISKLESRLAQVERERDAAVADFTQYVNYGERECNLCRHNEEVCLDCTWEWRGVKSNGDRRNQACNK